VSHGVRTFSYEASFTALTTLTGGAAELQVSLPSPQSQELGLEEEAYPLWLLHAPTGGQRIGEIYEAHQRGSMPRGGGGAGTITPI